MSGAVGTQTVGDDGVCAAVVFHRVLDESEGRGFVSRLRDEGFQHTIFAVDSTLQVAHLAIDFHVDLIQASLPVRELAHVRDPFPAGFSRKHRTELRSAASGRPRSGHP